MASAEKIKELRDRLNSACDRGKLNAPKLVDFVNQLEGAKRDNVLVALQCILVQLRTVGFTQEEATAVFVFAITRAFEVPEPTTTPKGISGPN